MADDWEARCVLSAVPHRGHRLDTTIVVTGSVVVCCLFRSVGFVFVVVLVVVASAVVGCTGCVVADFVDTGVACMVVVWVGVAMVAVLVFVVVGFIAVTFITVDGLVSVVVRDNNRWYVGSVGGAGKKGSVRTHTVQFFVESDLKSVQFFKKGDAV